MQKVAAWALFSAEMTPMQLVERQAGVQRLILAWREAKGTLLLTEGAQELYFRDGRSGKWTSASFFAAAETVEDMVLVEPSGPATFRTKVSVGTSGERIGVYIELQAGGGAYVLGPTHVDVRPPHILRSIIEEFNDWQCGETIVSTQPFRFQGREDAQILERALWHPQRNLPIIAISLYEGTTLSDDFASDLASDLAGVALVALLDDACSWHLTLARGKEWSTFNGAIRVYWPGLDSSDVPRRHPLWMRWSLLSTAQSPEVAVLRFREQLRRQLLGLSAFSVVEPVAFAITRAAHSRRELDEARQALTDDKDWEGLAASYSEDNEKLRREAERLDFRINELEKEVANLQHALQWQAQESAHEFQPEAEIPPHTVSEAVAAARQRFGDELIMGANVDAGVAGLAQDAGPPEKVLQYLEQLAEMVKLRREVGLGVPMARWLQLRNVECSGESLTTRNSASERRKRAWDAGGTSRFFETHLKPNDGAHPDRCVRIYFDYEEAAGKAVVGWIGRHP